MIQQAPPPLIVVVEEQTEAPPNEVHRLRLWALPIVQWVAIALPLMVVGWLVSGPLDLNQVEEHANEWFANNRTAWLNDATVIPTKLASTEGIVIVAGLAAFWFVITRRWPSLAMLTWVLAAELSIFLVVNVAVARPRPDVVKLDSVPATSSFPSGHVAATIVLYGTLALLATRRGASTPRVLLQWAFVTLAAASVAFARVYRGAHHVSDVIAGAALGIACVIAAERFAYRVAKWLHERGDEFEANDLLDIHERELLEKSDAA